MKKLFITILLFSIANSLLSSDKQAFIIYDKTGKIVSYTEMLHALSGNNIILFGELHNNPISHWLQLEFTTDIFKIKNDKLILGAEMFEADNQIIIDEYLKGYISYRNFKNDARLWSNFETDYKPLIEFAKAHSLQFIATNTPRRYASIVHSEGFEGLIKITEDAKKLFAPLPIAFDINRPAYKKMMQMEGMPGKTMSENFPKAQAIKDATMAHFILKNYLPNHVFLHYHGAFHSDFYDGIYWYLEISQPQLKIGTISTVEQNDILKLENEHLGRADYIICVPSNMTKTY